LVLDPNLLEAKIDLAYSYIRRGQLTEAKLYLEDAQRSDPLNGSVNNPLLTIYERLALWDQARDLIENQIQHLERPDDWKFHLARLNYLQSGNLEKLKAESKQLDIETERSYLRLYFALILRDYPSILTRLESRPPDGILGFRNPHGLSLGLTPMVKSLVYFELGDRGKWLIETKELKTYLEEYTQTDSLADPFYWSQLPMCYALEGDRDKLEASIGVAREKVIEQNLQYTLGTQTEVHIAIAYMILGENEKAIDILEAAFQQENILLKRELGMWFIFDRLRGNPRFDKLLED
jgi:tetratricopeptide (TPR) repeat protein